MKKCDISQIDTIFANGSYPIEFLIYYRSKLDTEKIRSVLDILSSSFWPMFGRYNAGVIHFTDYSEEDCFDETVTDEEFTMEDTNKNIYEKYSHSIPTDLNSLFLLKILQYKNGTVLIPKLNHLAGDGYSYFYFLSVLSALYLENNDPAKQQILNRAYKPHHHRTVLKDFHFNGVQKKLSQDYENLTIEFMNIPRSSVRTMIKDIASDHNQTVSTNDILSAMVLQKYSEVQPGLLENDVQLTIPMDVRMKIKEYGSKFFGNALMFCVTNFEKKDFKEITIENTAIEIRKCMPAVSKESYIEYLNNIEAFIDGEQTEKLRPYDPEKGCLVTNLSLMPVKKLDFGTGPPDFIFPMTIGKNSAAILADKDHFILRLAY